LVCGGQRRVAFTGSRAAGRGGLFARPTP
jgi:hypothetical protein